METDIYRKETDTQNYIHFHSNHPRHVIKNIPYALAKRIIKIVSLEINRSKQLRELEKQLLKLKYPQGVIDYGISRALREETSPVRKENNTTKIIPFVSTYNKNNPDIYNKVIKLISTSLSLMEPFQRYKFIRSWKQPPSLFNLLNKNNRPVIHGITKCEEPRCGCCPILITGKHINIMINKKLTNFEIKRNMNCLSKNIIYILRCNGCNAIYVGQSGYYFRNRLTVHRQQIAHANYRVLKVSQHIASCGKDQDPMFSAAPIYKLCASATKIDRERQEQIFMSMFRPSLNSD